MLGTRGPWKIIKLFNQINWCEGFIQELWRMLRAIQLCPEPSQQQAQGALPVGVQMREKGLFSRVSCGSPKKLPAGHTQEAVTRNDPQTGRWHCHVFAIKIAFSQVKGTWILHKALASSHLYTHINNTRDLCIYVFDT